MSGQIPKIVHRVASPPPRFFIGAPREGERPPSTQNFRQAQTLRSHASPTSAAVERHMNILSGALPAYMPLKCKMHAIAFDNALIQSGGEHANADRYNPSITDHAGALWCVVRVVNKARHTRNLIGRLAFRSGDWRLERGHWIEDKVPGSRENAETRGYQDCRLFVHNGKLCASAVVCDLTPGDTKPKIALLEFDAAGDIVAAHVQRSDRWEKNWMPAVVDDELHFVYSTDPTIALRYDDATCEVVPSALQVPKYISQLRGGSQLIPYEDGYIAVVHQVHQAHPLIYLHRFVLFDRELQFVRKSAAFYFDKLGIEFCAGIVERRDGFMMSLGTDDRHSWIATVERETVRAMLAPRATHADACTLQRGK